MFVKEITASFIIFYFAAPFLSLKFFLSQASLSLYGFGYDGADSPPFPPVSFSTEDKSYAPFYKSDNYAKLSEFLSRKYSH